MHATIHRYEGVSAPIDEVMRAGRQLASALSEAPGFISYAILDAGDGVLAAVSVFESQAELEQADRLAGQWVTAHLAVPMPHSLHITTGEVVVQKGM